MMNPKILVISLMCVASVQLFGQTKVRKLPYAINRSSVNNYAPYISLDGNSLVYTSTMAEDDALTMAYTVREGVTWKEPVIVPKPINTRSNFLKGHALNADGKILYITSSKSNGLGGFDMYGSQLVQGSWREPENLGYPINTNGHEGCPSFSFDGTMMFFMRCGKMDFESADNCKIMMTKKKAGGEWEVPIELPAFINTGNSQTPRIMGDGETLVFASNKLKPNKGGMDLYETKLIQGQWTNPVPLDFVNTSDDDQYVSATSVGRYLMRDFTEQHASELVEILFPTEVRPKGVMKIQGTVAGLDDPSSSTVSIFNKKDQSRVFSTKPGKDGTFIAYLKEGAVYHLFIDPEKDNYTYFSKTFDLTGDKFKIMERVNANLKPPGAGDEIELGGISFKANSSELDAFSSQELRRLIKMMKANSGKSFSVLVTLEGYQKDSVRSSPDLTEVIVDTLKIPVNNKVDSVTTARRDSLVIKTTYHNDRTMLQAKALGDYLFNMGIPEGRLACSGKSKPETIPENRKTVVTVVTH